jgi:hypothetical protein
VHIVRPANSFCNWEECVHCEVWAEAEETAEHPAYNTT